MAQDWVKQKTRTSKELQSITYYGILGVHPSASALDIRRAYRELSKRYHPDTTDLPKETAKRKFQQLNEAYATLSNPERRILYDQTIRYSRVNVIQPPPGLNRPVVRSRVEHSSSAYLDPTRPSSLRWRVICPIYFGDNFRGMLGTGNCNWLNPRRQCLSSVWDISIESSHHSTPNSTTANPAISHFSPTSLPI